jgi:ABC-2 type transport system ATP-binding protein
VPTLEARHLTKRYGTVTALDDASFRFDGAGAIGYLGPNGAGKTTTLKLMTHLASPSSGEALINGIDVTREPKDALWNVGTVIESPEPYPWQTGRQALQMVADFRGIDRGTTEDRIRELTVDLDLPPLDRKTGKLSKGQRQRVVIASALLGDPPIVLLDEPTSGLDPAERVVIRNTLLKLKGERLILMSSHLLSEVEEICDRAIFISRGKILLNDRVAAIRDRRIGTELEVEFADPTPPDRLASLTPLVREVKAISPTRLRVSFDGNRGARDELLRRCMQLGSVVSFETVQVSLEDTYLELMGSTSQQTAPVANA